MRPSYTTTTLKVALLLIACVIAAQLQLMWSSSNGQTVQAAMMQNPLATPTPPRLGGTGSPFPDTSAVNDQKAGSVLVYPIYTSDASGSVTQNTRISLTNADTLRDAAVHLFFVDGNSCSVADAYICLTPNQTATFLASDFDPGTTGYIVAVATDRNGVPTAHNALIGDLYVKFASGHRANLTAEAFSAQLSNPTFSDGTNPVALINFDGVSYNQAPSSLAASNIPSRAEGNDTLLILNRIGGNLATGLDRIGNVFGIFYDDAEKPLSFSFLATSCQFRSSISNSFPRLTPRFESFIGLGRSGWFRLYQFNGTPMIGATINATQAGATGTTFEGGHNLHKLSLAPSATFTVPVFPPACL